jgi:hypothetical protein
MNDYGKPQTFTLDHGQMNQLFELLDKALGPARDYEPGKAPPLECLRALRNDLYRRLD